MAITISPAKAAVDAAAKPYVGSMTATLDFQPASYAWYADGVMVHFGVAWTSSGPGVYTIPGPDITFAAAPKTVRADVQPVSGAMQSAQYTTADQRTPAAVTTTLVRQKNGVPIVSGETIPMTPWATPIPGQTQISLGWSHGAQGEASRADIIVRVAGHDEAGGISKVNINWGDGSDEDVGCENVSDVLFDHGHTYSGTTGNLTVTSTLYNRGAVAGAVGILPVTIPTDATGWRSSQYRLQEYQDQVGFRSVAVVGWRGITNDPKTFTLYNKRRGHTFNYQLQLREVDTTGRPLLTSALSAVASAGPW